MTAVHQFPPTCPPALHAYFAVEIIQAILWFLPFKDVLMYGMTAKYSYRTVRDFLLCQSRELVRPFVPSPVEFFRLLEDFNAVISGSTVLSFFDFSFVPKDLDIYAPILNESAIATYLTGTAGYVEVIRTPVQGVGPQLGITMGGNPDDEYYASNAHISHVRKFVRGANNVDVIISTTQSAIIPIFAFHSTAVMNFMTGHGVYSAYPALTLNKLSVLNPSTLIRFNIPTGRVVDAIQKYTIRGYRLAVNPHTFEGHTHHCRRSPECPHTRRNTWDTYGLFINLMDILVWNGSLEDIVVVVEGSLSRNYACLSGNLE